MKRGLAQLLRILADRVHTEPRHIAVSVSVDSSGLVHFGSPSPRTPGGENE